MKLTTAYYQHTDVVALAPTFLGKVLVTVIDGELTSGVITEVEAYAGVNDKACHAHMKKVTARNIVMYEPGGCLYAYLCYGIHTLMNIVTNQANQADAVLIRGIEPVDGLAVMEQRRGKTSGRDFANGPGKLSQALGASPALTGMSLQSDVVWLEDRGIEPPTDFQKLKRVGIDYAGEDANLLWRFKVNTLFGERGHKAWCNKL